MFISLMPFIDIEDYVAFDLYRGRGFVHGCVCLRLPVFIAKDCSAERTLDSPPKTDSNYINI